MKKTYIKPQTEVINYSTQGLLAASLNIYGNSGKTIDSEEEYLSNKGGWSSSNWTEKAE